MSLTFSGPVPVVPEQPSPLSVLVTGASRGLGLELVRQYAAAHPSHVVLAGVRQPSAAASLQAVAAAHTNVRIVPLDVDSDASLHTAPGRAGQLCRHQPGLGASAAGYD